MTGDFFQTLCVSRLTKVRSFATWSLPSETNLSNTSEARVGYMRRADGEGRFFVETLRMVYSARAKWSPFLLHETLRLKRRRKTLHHALSRCPEENPLNRELSSSVVVL